MTLQNFETLISPFSTLTLRRAMTLALSVEAPRTHAAYARFYCRVIAELGVAFGTDCEKTARKKALVAA